LSAKNNHMTLQHKKTEFFIAIYTDPVHRRNAEKLHKQKKTNVSIHHDLPHKNLYK